EDFTRHDLAAQQIDAINLFKQKKTRDFYLYGDTGSGKTEVYLSLAEECIRNGKGVIYLVPEITLTHQLVQEAARRFHGKIAVIHSAITPSQKLAEWKRIRQGEGLFVIGARSAVFAPVKNPGLFIIDEEHEGSYKSGSNPRYHARQVAMKRAGLQDARCILGSATPSVEAYRLMDEGRIGFCRMKERLAGGRKPNIEIVNMCGEKKSISRTLLQDIKSTLDAGKQVILFLNRRGFSYFFHCRSCGYEMSCRQCSVSLTYHRNQNRMICHYCGYSQDPVQFCPECGSLDVGYSGFGTERIEQEINDMFPEQKIVRVDTDSIKKKGTLQRILKDFRSGKYRIMLGTQMVAKGLNFPGVSLVGIVNADTGLHLPDFRAQERVFALITQVAGRAGRFLPDGKVVIQTFSPDNAAIKYSAMEMQDEFYKRELQIREMLSFPPFTRIVRFVIRGKNKHNVVKNAGSLYEYIQSIKVHDLEITGPGECPLAMIAGNYRYQIMLRCPVFNTLIAAATKTRSNWKPEKNNYLEIDVDPVSLL
ncbi:MAG: primosomal protein N', partial [Spirochaetales bacterium]|nr:primosomal protein N' [Spirochaetales bacterium]